MKVLFITNVPSPYRVDFFNELGKLCELTVLFEKKTSDERDESWKKYQFDNFNGVFLKGLSVNTDSAVCFGVLKYINRKKYDKIIVSSYSSPTGILALIKLKMHRISYYLEVDGGLAKTGKGIKEKIKRFLISGAYGYFSTADETDKFLMAYGAKKEKIIRYPFTSLSQNDLDRVFTINEKDKEYLRKQLRIKEKKIIICPCHYLTIENCNLLYEIFSQLEKNVGVYFLIDRSCSVLNSKLISQLSSVHIVSLSDGRDINYYLGASDLFFYLPTCMYDSLAIIKKATSYGLPIVSLPLDDSMSKLVDESNCFFIDANNLKHSGKMLNIFINDDVTLSSFSNFSIKKMEKQLFDNKDKSYIDALDCRLVLNRIISRDKLSIKSEDFVVLSIGQFIPRKGFDILLRSIVGIKDLKLFIIGGIPPKEYLKIVNDNDLSNVTFLPHMGKNDLDLYFKASDLFVLPTREDIWGLVINEAISYGLPIITTNKCIAGLELIKNASIGKIIEAENIAILKKSISEFKNILTNKTFKERIDRLSLIREYTIEKMAAVHAKALSE